MMNLKKIYLKFKKLKFIKRTLQNYSLNATKKSSSINWLNCMSKNAKTQAALNQADHLMV